MMDSGVREWLVLRRPPIPGAFLPLLTEEDSGRAAAEAPADGGPVGPSEQMAGAALSALRHALAHPGRDRTAAFRLLVGDALLTYACEAALDRSDPRSALEELLTVTGAGLRP